MDGLKMHKFRVFTSYDVYRNEDICRIDTLCGVKLEGDQFVFCKEIEQFGVDFQVERKQSYEDVLNNYPHAVQTLKNLVEQKGYDWRHAYAPPTHR